MKLVTRAQGFVLLPIASLARNGAVPWSPASWAMSAQPTPRANVDANTTQRGRSHEATAYARSGNKFELDMPNASARARPRS